MICYSHSINVFEMENDGSEFGKQFAGSAAANVVFMVGLLLYKFLEGRCKHSKCSSNTQFCKCNVDNYETERSIGNKLKNAFQSEKSVPQMHARDRKKISPRHSAIETLELRDPESFEGDPREPRVAKGENIV